MAANKALNSVPKESLSGCANPETGKNYKYEELEKLYQDAESSEARAAATQMIKICSALRIIPDALPAFKNEEALLSSLNKIFIESDWQPESLSPSGEEEAAEFGEGLNAITVNLSVESDMSTTARLINNMERSIRNFNIKSAAFEWSGGNISFSANAQAFYVNKAGLAESSYTVPVEGK